MLNIITLHQVTWTMQSTAVMLSVILSGSCYTIHTKAPYFPAYHTAQQRYEDLHLVPCRRLLFSPHFYLVVNGFELTLTEHVQGYFSLWHILQWYSGVHYSAVSLLMRENNGIFRTGEIVEVWVILLWPTQEYTIASPW